MRLHTVLFLAAIVFLACISVIELSGPFDVISNYSISGDKITLHGAACAIGFFLIFVGFGNFLGRSASVTVRLITKSKMSHLQEWTIELMISGVGGIIGIALWYYLGVLHHI
ncbi:MAG TPA: hypothetical protein VNF46_03140 [Gammaproteobacteria bacterium]|nr:hypothetical protein [Gammaproteobacteria bacterium]